MPEAFTIGWVYNLHDPQATTHASRLIAIAITFSVFACFAVSLRFAVRKFMTRQLGADDWAVLSSAVFGVGYSAIAVYQTRWGQALDAQFFPPENILKFSKIQYSGGPTYCLALLGFKISILLSYQRIAGFNRIYHTVIYIVIFLVTANQICFALVLSFACRPVAKQWNSLLPGTCIDQVESYYALAGTSLAFDILIISLPFPVLRRLQLDVKRKIILGSLFALGFFVTIIQIIRIFTIAKLVHYTDSEAIVSWSAVEINLGVFLACIPTYAPLFKTLTNRSQSRGQLYSGNRGLRRSRSGYSKSGQSKPYIDVVKSKLGWPGNADPDLKSSHGLQMLSDAPVFDGTTPKLSTIIDSSIRPYGGVDKERSRLTSHVEELPDEGGNRHLEILATTELTVVVENEAHGLV